jgi:hypothetical protein
MGEVRLVLRPLVKREGEDDVPVPLDGSADPRTFTLDSDLSQIISPPGGNDESGKDSVQVVRGASAAQEETQ